MYGYGTNTIAFGISNNKTMFRTLERNSEVVNLTRESFIDAPLYEVGNSNTAAVNGTDIKAGAGEIAILYCRINDNRKLFSIRNNSSLILSKEIEPSKCGLAIQDMTITTN